MAIAGVVNTILSDLKDAPYGPADAKMFKFQILEPIEGSGRQSQHIHVYDTIDSKVATKTWERIETGDWVYCPNCQIRQDKIVARKHIRVCGFYPNWKGWDKYTERHKIKGGGWLAVVRNKGEVFDYERFEDEKEAKEWCEQQEGGDAG